MKHLRREISKHGFAVEMTALVASIAGLVWLLVDAMATGADTARMIGDLVAALILGGIITGTVLAVGEPVLPLESLPRDN